MLIPFVKMHGAANDFVVIDHRRPFLPADPAALVRRLCDRRRGIGADGVLLLETDDTADALMRYFNSDGGVADYCGNGARCLARFALDRGLGRSGRLALRTAVGVQQATWEGDLVRLHFGVVERASERFDVEVNGRRFPGRYVRAGVPHFVVPAEPLEQVRVGEWGASLRHHARFAPEGANVDFVARQTAGGVAMRTYERGVEGETLACGSGAIATALWAAAEGATSPVRVRTAGGDDLVVAFDARGPAYDVTLVGPAEVAFEGTWREAGLDGPDAPRGGG